MGRASIWILYARPVNFSTGSLAAAAGYDVQLPYVSGAFMLDVILIAAALGFFALSVAYAVGCNRL
jgi:hypothetical protein